MYFDPLDQSDRQQSQNLAAKCTVLSSITLLQTLPSGELSHLFSSDNALSTVSPMQRTVVSFAYTKAEPEVTEFGRSVIGVQGEQHGAQC